MQLARIVSEIMTLVDGAMKELNQQVNVSKDPAKTYYQDYRRQLREVAGLVYSMIGKMRVDRVLDPPELEALDRLVTGAIEIGLQPDTDSPQA